MGLRRIYLAGTRTWPVLVSIPVLILVYFAAFWLRFEGRLAGDPLRSFIASAPWVLGIKLAVFHWFGIFHRWRRFFTSSDMVSLAKATAAGSLVFAAVDYLLLSDYSVPRSVFLVDCAATMGAMAGIWFAARSLTHRDPAFLRSRAVPVFIVGANDSGEALLWGIRRNSRLNYRVIGFIAGIHEEAGGSIGGVPILGKLEDTCRLAKQHGVADVFITAGELSGRQVRQLVEQARRHDVTVKVLPSYEQLLRGQIDLRPRKVSIEDLLRRDPVQLDMQKLHCWIDGKVLMVTGSAGSIGSEICRQLLQFAPQKLVLVDRSETGQFYLDRELRKLAPELDIEVCLADINDAMRMNSLFTTHQPDIVIHAAAYKHVPLMEANIGEAVKNISLASRLLADLAHRHGAQSFVMISSDKAVNPTNVMGACKRVAELYVQALASKSTCRFVTVRFGNVLDSAGSVVPVFRQQIATGGPVTITHPDMTRYFMTIPEASQLVIQAGAMGRGGEIFVLDMGEPVRILDLARDMIRLSGLRVDEDIELQIVGRRPGEKLYEELHVDGETHVPTSHPKILVAESKSMELQSVAKSLERLARITDHPHAELLAELHQLVPEFTHDREFVESKRIRAA